VEDAIEMTIQQTIVRVYGGFVFAAGGEIGQFVFVIVLGAETWWHAVTPPLADLM